jgi:hypothetical protein
VHRSLAKRRTSDSSIGHAAAVPTQQTKRQLGTLTGRFPMYRNLVTHHSPINALAKLLVLSASWMMWSPVSPVSADEIVAVDISNLTFQTTPSETFHFTFQWDNTTEAPVSGTVHITGTGAPLSDAFLATFSENNAFVGSNPNQLFPAFGNNLPNSFDESIVFTSLIEPLVSGVFDIA